MSEDKPDQVFVQMATRIPKLLHRAVKLHCLKADKSMMEVVIESLEATLARVKAGKAK